MKKLFALLALMRLALAISVGVAAFEVSTATPAQAVEISTDVGCDDSSKWMLQTNWTLSGSKCVGTNVTALKMLMQMTPLIKDGHRYRISGTASGVTAGAFRFFVGVTMPSAPTGSWVTAASVSSVPDTFTTSLGLATGFTPKGLTGPGDSAEVGGAFRFGCNSGGFARKDPLVYPGGRSPHLHEDWGNTGWLTAKDGESWVFTDFRTRGASSCANHTDPTHAIVRTAYWQPAFLDGLGNAKRAAFIQVYYKGPSNPALNYTGAINPEGGAAAAAACAADSPTADCRNIPTGLRMTFGWRSSDGLCGPLDVTNTGNSTTPGCSFNQHTAVDCWGGPNNEGGPKLSGYTAVYRDLNSLMNANVCVKGSWLHVGGDFPYCWDGVNVDSPNHRDHINWGNNVGVCTASHPVRLPTISVQAFYLIDDAFLAHKWHLSSDEMATSCSGAAVTAGCTYHMDYWEAWSPTVRDTWFNKCIWAHNSGSTEICDGNGLKGGAINFDGTDVAGNGGQLTRLDDVTPLTKFGMSKDYTANGTFTADITADGSGVWGVMGSNSFTGSLDNISIQEIPSGQHAANDNQPAAANDNQIEIAGVAPINFSLRALR